MDNKDYARTPEEVAALPEVQAACDDLVWKTNERERASEHYRKQYPTAPHTEPGIAHRGGYINGFIAAKREAGTEAFHSGVIEGMRRFAWWKDGIEYVGTCGKTLKQAIDDFKKEADHAE